jgi:hypothetical protein
MANNNGSLHGRRKLYAALIFSCGCLISCTLLTWVGKISGTEYTQGLSTAGLAIMAYLGANAVQKFAKNGGDK